MKSLSAEHTFESDVSDRSQVLAKLSELAARLHHRLQSAGYEYRVVGVKIRFTHFQTYTRENTLPNHTDDKVTLLSEARNLLREFEGNNQKVRLIGIRVSDLQPREIQRKAEGLEAWLQGNLRRLAYRGNGLHVRRLRHSLIRNSRVCCLFLRESICATGLSCAWYCNSKLSRS